MKSTREVSWADQISIERRQLIQGHEPISRSMQQREDGQQRKPGFQRKHWYCPRGRPWIEGFWAVLPLERDLSNGVGHYFRTLWPRIPASLTAGWWRFYILSTLTCWEPSWFHIETPLLWLQALLGKGACQSPVNVVSGSQTLKHPEWPEKPSAGLALSPQVLVAQGGTVCCIRHWWLPVNPLLYQVGTFTFLLWFPGSGITLIYSTTSVSYL